MKITEEWKDIVGYEGLYQVSNYGNVKCVGRGNARMIVQRVGTKKNGAYMLLNLNNDGVYKTKKAHRLVAEAFIPNPDNKPTVNHKDGNKQNNKVSNLEWATWSENNFRAFKIGLRVPNVDNVKIRGSKNVWAKISEKDVLKIRELHRCGMRQVDIAKLYPVNSRNINNIVTKRSWRHV